MVVALVCCFCGRWEKVCRVIRCFLNQTYARQTYLILYNNSPVEMELDLGIELPEHKEILLINRNIDLVTKEDYKSVGEIFRDAVTFVPRDSDIINFFDSDDIFLPSHVLEGVVGMEKAYSEGRVGYKPYYSWFLWGDKVSLEHNNMEPSVFVDKEYLKKAGFNYSSADYHQKWLSPIQNNGRLLEEEEGTPTFIYDWSSDHNTHKISGSGDNGYRNFVKHRRFHQDYGDRILRPSNPLDVQYYYNLVKGV